MTRVQHSKDVFVQVQPKIRRNCISGDDTYSKNCVKRPLSKRQKICFQNQLSLNAGQRYCRMLQGEHSAILLTFIKLSFVIKIFVLSFLSGGFIQVFLYFACVLLHNVMVGLVYSKAYCTFY